MKKLTIAIIIVNLVLLVGIVYSLNIKLIYPENNEKIFETRPTLSWEGYSNKYTILIDDNKEFSSPIKETVYTNNYVLNKELEFGRYYWQVSSLLSSSKVNEFEIVSKVAIKVNQTEDDIDLYNDGNANLNVTVEDSGILTGAFIIEVKKNMIFINKENRSLNAKQDE